MQLTSVHHPQLQLIRKAASSGRPMPNGLVVAEGPHLLAEVGRSNWRVEQILYTGEARARFGALIDRDIPVTELGARAFASIANTETTQGLVALIRPPHWSWEQVLGGRALAIVLDGIQDPGNVGTIVRSAEAFGATGVVLAEGCARISNGKVLRASAGSLFRLPYLEGVTRVEIKERLRAEGLKVYALAAGGELPVSEARFGGRNALLVGNEGSGVSAELLATAEAVRIPTLRVESLNAAVACSIALFEAARQRDVR